MSARLVPPASWHYLPWAVSAIAVMIAAIVADKLGYVHVFSSSLWTGIDLFMRFVLGPVLYVGLTLRNRRMMSRRRAFTFPNYFSALIYINA